MARAILVHLQGGIGANFPDDRVNGRFILRGTIVDSNKPVLGKEVIIEMTHAHLKELVNYGASSLLRHPKCGTTPKDDDDG